GELWVGLYKRKARPDAMTCKQALDEALCAGWIDGVRKSIDAALYTIRFTPRKPRSYWSQVNIRRAEELVKLDRMTPHSLAVFEKRETRPAKYSFENRLKRLAAPYEKQFRANPKAWEFFRAQAPWYQRTTSFWVMDAKQEETRQRRLTMLIADSGKGKRLDLLSPRSKKK